MDPETYIERLGQIVAAKKYAHAHAFAAKNHAPLAERFTNDQREAIRALMATVDAAPPPKPIPPQGDAIVLRSREDALDLTIFGDPEEKTVAQMRRCLTMPEAAAGKVKYVRDATGRKQMQRLGGEVTPEMMREAVRTYGVEVRGAGPDESPFVYRKLADVLAAHAGTLAVRHVLQPIGVVMAGEGEVDPYKD